MNDLVQKKRDLIHVQYPKHIYLAPDSYLGDLVCRWYQGCLVVDIFNVFGHMPLKL